VIFVVDRFGRISVLSMSDYIKLPVEAVIETRVFFSIAQAFEASRATQKEMS